MQYGKVTPIALCLMFQCHPLLAASVASGVVAETQPTRSGESNAASSDPSDEAEALFAVARKKYEAGDLPGALSVLQRCYELTHAANLLYNLALLYHELADCSKALEHFQRYIQEAADGERRDDANQQIAALSQKCPPPSPAQAARQAVPESTQPPQLAAAPTSPPVIDTSSARPHYWSSVGWVALGAGAMAGATAIYFAVQAVQANHDAEKRPITADYYNERSATLTRDSTYAWAFGATSVVAIGVGVYSLTVAAPKQQSVSAAFTTTLSPSAALVGYRLRF